MIKEKDMIKDHQPSDLIINEHDISLDGADTSSDDKTSIHAPYDVSKIRIEPKNLSLDLILKRLKEGEIDLTPDFQRYAGIWTARVQSRLIESLLLRIPIPAFYFDATNNDRWLVVDGLQRLTALNEFVNKESFVLQGLEFLGTEYNGFFFSKLPRSLRRTIEETILVTYQIMEGTPEEVKFNVFQRINTGGLPLSPQEIRHALNRGPVLDLINTLSKGDEFVNATSNGVPEKRMDDKECITRFIVFSILPPEHYDKNDYDAYLNRGMKAANMLSAEELAKLGSNFLRVMHAAHKIFGNDAFRKRYTKSEGRYPINKALFEAWSVNMGLLSDDELSQLILRKEVLKELFMQLMQQKDFDTSVSQGTGSSVKVKTRFKKIKEIIHEALYAQ